MQIQALYSLYKSYIIQIQERCNANTSSIKAVYTSYRACIIQERFHANTSSIVCIDRFNTSLYSALSYKPVEP